jgi:hypothetical protein
MKINFRIFVPAMLLLAVLVGIGYALTPPPPPPPPVNQNIGIYDTSIAFFHTNATDQSACRACHTSGGTAAPGYNNASVGGVDTRHHKLVQEGVTNPLTNSAFGCPDCHPNTPGVGNGVLLDHSCTDCHNSSSFWADSALGAHVGNLSRPHHFNTSYDDAGIGNPVAARQCKTCHGSFVDNYNDGHYIPSYNTTDVITPYAKWKAASTTALAQTLYSSDGAPVNSKTWGGCESCHLGQINTTLAALGQFSGNPILPNHDIHHQEILDGGVNVSGTIINLGGRTPGATCSWCHVILPGQAAHGGVFLFNFTNQFTGETVFGDLEVRNSSIEQADLANGSLEPGTVNVTINGTGCEKCHSVASLHSVQFNYVQNGPQGFGHINNNTDCNGCHNDWVPADTGFTPGALVPAISGVNPSVIPAPSSAVTLTITGQNLENPDGSYAPTVTVDGATYNPTSVSPTQVAVSIPAAALTQGVHTLQVVKAGTTTSKIVSLLVVPNVAITSAKLQAGTITITGTGFGSTPGANSNMYVSVLHGTNVIVSKSVKWGTSITANFKNLPVVKGDTVVVETAAAGAATAVIS